MKPFSLGVRTALVLGSHAILLWQLQAQPFSGTNAPGTYQDFDLTLGPGTTNVSISIDNSSSVYSHLLLKAGTAPGDADYDFIAAADGGANAINLESPELVLTNYVLRVRTPTTSLAHNFTVTVETNVADMRSTPRPATKPLVSVSQGAPTSGAWQFFRIDVPTNVTGWRIVLSSASPSPDLYLQRGGIPTPTTYLRRSTGLTNDCLAFGGGQMQPGPYYIAVVQSSGTNAYTLRTEMIYFNVLSWDPGVTHLGTQVYTNSNPDAADYYFKITTQNTAVGAWRTALTVLAGEANVYLSKGWPPTAASNSFRSERAGSDGFVVSSSSFSAGEDWYLLVQAATNSQWTLVSGESFVTDLGAVTGDGSSGSGPVPIGSEGIRFFRTTVPVDTVAWRLWLNGATNAILLKKTLVPLPGSSEVSQSAQLLVVPPYLVAGQTYYVGVEGAPGTEINLDSRQQTFADIPFTGSTNVSISGFGYSVYRVQVPVEQIAWQVTVVASNGNPNVAVRRNLVASEWYNDAFSEVPGTVTDSILLVPPTLSDGTFFITVYTTNSSCAFTLNSGTPEVTEIDYVGSTLNTDTNRVGWRLFKLTDIDQQRGSLGWDLFLTNAAPGTRIALRRNAAPSVWTYRNQSTYTSGEYDYISAKDFLQRPGHQADIWYVGVYNPTNALGNFTLITRELTATTIPVDSGPIMCTDVPVGKWLFFRVDIPTNVLGWDVRLNDMVGGSAIVVVRRELLPISTTQIGFSGSVTASNWASGNQWVAGADWTGRNYTQWGTNDTGRIVTVGYGRPLEAGTYYVGVTNSTGTTNTSYTLLSRGIGPGFAIPVEDIAYVGEATNAALAARDIAIYRVDIPSNSPSWKVKLTPTTGDSGMTIARGAIPNITAAAGGSVTNSLTAGKKMLKAGNEHFALMPNNYDDTIMPGTYYILVASEGLVDPSYPTRIGPGSASFLLQSLGPMPEIDLGHLETNLVYTSSLEGGECIALHFDNYPWPETLGFELNLMDKTGNPTMVSRGTAALANPGTSSSGEGSVPTDTYGNEGGQGDGLVASTLCIDVSDPYETETVMVKARLQSSLYPDATYTLHIQRLVAPPLAFDGGTTNIVGQTNRYQFFEIDVPTNALGWDVRITEVTEGSPKLVIERDALPFWVAISWEPGNSEWWPSWYRWLAGDDWTERDYSSDGTQLETSRILAMGMGQPLEPGRYYVGVRNLSTEPMSYRITSRGIGDGFVIPVTDLEYTGGTAGNLALHPREADYYRIIIPTNYTSSKIQLTATAGECLLMFETNYVPNVKSGLSGCKGRKMKKLANEHFLLLPPSYMASLPPGTNFLAVVGEGTVSEDPNRIGTDTSGYILESHGELLPINLGVIGTEGVTNSGSLQGGEVLAYQFTVPEGTLSVAASLENATGNPVMVLRVGPVYPNPGAASVGTGRGSVGAEAYGNEGGLALPGFGQANTNLITVANPSNTVYTVMVKARGLGGLFPDATYTLCVRAMNCLPVDFDGGSVTITNQPLATWRYFRVDVPDDCLGWDIRLVNVTSGLPRISVCRDAFPFSLTTTPWGAPGTSIVWPTTNQWAAGADWTRRTYNADGTISEDGRILAMGLCQPLEPGTYYIGVINNSGTSPMSYTLLSRGIGGAYSLPVVDLPYDGGVMTNTDLFPREAAYYRVSVPSNSPGWKVKMTPSAGEAMLLMLERRVPNVDTGRSTHSLSGKYMAKAGNEHYVVVPDTGQTNIIAQDYFLTVVSEGVNPASSTRIGTGTSSYTLESEEVELPNLGTVSYADLVSSNSLQGGEARFHRFDVPEGVQAIELRLDDRVGHAVLVVSTNLYTPDPGGVVVGTREAYGNDGGIIPFEITSNIVTIANPPAGTFSVAVKARQFGTQFPDASYTLRVRQVAVTDLNFTPEFNTNGLSNIGSGLLQDGQRAYYRVEVPTNVWDKPVLGWLLDLSQLSGSAALRVRKDLLPSDKFTTGMVWTPNAAAIAMPFLTNGTWYLEVRGTNSTEFTVASSAVALQRPAWRMPGIGETSTTPGVSSPMFADSGVNTNGAPLPGDQGIDLQQGRYHFYAALVPTNNAGLMRVQLDVISGNADLYMRMHQIPTATHKTNGTAGTMLDRTCTGLVTEYANWVPLNGQSEAKLVPGTWYFAVRAVEGANARYRLRLSTGDVQDLLLDGGEATNQIVTANDWKYFRVQIPVEMDRSWQVTFNQLSGDVVMYVRDITPPGNGGTLTEYKDWDSDNKNAWSYAAYDLPGAYTFPVPPLRPGSTYYIGFRAKIDSTFSVSSMLVGPTNPLPPFIEFYGGSVSNLIPIGGQIAYRIWAPEDALRWRSTSIHSNLVQIYLENGTWPTKAGSDDWRSSSAANTTIDRYMTNFPWLPNITYFMVITNTSTAYDQPFSFTMNGIGNSADQDGDGMADGWEIQYFGSLAQLPGGDYDNDTVSNLDEYIELTNPRDPASYRPRLYILATNGIVGVAPPTTTNYAMGTAVTLVAVPNAGYVFVRWGGDAAGTANPCVLIMNSHKTIIPAFRVPADDFEQRITLPRFTCTYAGLRNSGATKQPGEPDHGGDAGGASLWWTWTAPISGQVCFSTAGSDFRNAVAVYTGTAVEDLTLVTENLADAGTTAAQVIFDATEGTVYQIAVDGFYGATGAVTMNVSLPGAIVLTRPWRDASRLFHFTVEGPALQVLQIDAATQAFDWQYLTTITNFSGATEVVDPDSANLPFRLYRAVLIDTIPEVLLLSSPSVDGGGQFSFLVVGATNRTIRVQAADILPAFSTIYTVTNSPGAVLFSEPVGGSSAYRYYRAITP